MVKLVGVIVLVVFAFVAGVMYQRMDQSEVSSLNQKISNLEEELGAQRGKSDDLRETLNLVKRQIQTDRIAYQELQRIVEGSDEQRAELRQQIEDQQRLLKSVRERLEKSEN
jgi:septation ring formation regulator EzrA